MKMPIGKYAGQPLDSIPRDYLQWFLQNVKNLPEVTLAIRQMFAIRGDKPQDGGRGYDDVEF